MGFCQLFCMAVKLGPLHKLQVSKNKLLRKTFGLDMGDVSEQLRDIHRSPTVLRIMKPMTTAHDAVLFTDLESI